MNPGTKCKWCGVSTTSISYDECNNCWELRFRIEDNPDLALKILQSLDKKESDME